MSEKMIVKIICSMALGLLASAYINSGTGDGVVLIAIAFAAGFFVALSFISRRKDNILYFLGFFANFLWRVSTLIAKFTGAKAQKLWKARKGSLDE